MWLDDNRVWPAQALPDEAGSSGEEESLSSFSYSDDGSGVAPRPSLRRLLSGAANFFNPPRSGTAILRLHCGLNWRNNGST